MFCDVNRKAFPDQFEETVKMHCLPLISTNDDFENVTTSKRRDMDFEETYNGPQYELNSYKLEYESNHQNLQFFKDPLNIPDEQLMEESMSDLRPGRSMRACKSVSSQCKDIPDMLNKRKYLLEKQREQKLKFEKEENRSQIATALINGLINEGFEIKPPNQTPRVSELTSLVPVFKDVSDVEEKMLFVDCYKELKRVQVNEG